MRLGHKNYDPNPGEGGGGGNPDTANEAEIVEFETLSAKDAAALTAEEKVRFDALSAKYEVQELDEEGKPLSPEAKAKFVEVKTKVDAILAKPEDKRTPEEIKYLTDNTEEDKSSTKSVWEQVDEMTGRPVEVDYEAEGIKDPTSPEGVALREEVIREQTIAEYEQVMKEKAPRAYELMIHLAQGGKEEDFFAPENEDFSRITVKKDDLAGAERVYRKALVLKGNAPDEIDALVQTAKDNSKLYDKAKAELEALQQGQAERTTRNEQRIRALEKKKVEDMDKMGTTLETKIKSGFGGIQVPILERQKFLAQLGSSITYDGRGNFLLVKEVKAENIDNVLKTEYFGFKNGDLKTVADNLAKTKNAIKIKNSFKTKVVPKSQGERKVAVPLSQI